MKGTHMKKEIKTKKGMAPVGPYSQAIRAGGFVFCSGNIGVDPKTGKLVEGIEKQTKQTIQNIANVLEDAGLTLANIVKTTVYLKNMDDFLAMNGIYGEVFTKPCPARATIQVVKLPKDALVEIECIAVIDAAKGEDCCGGGCCS
jgi:2-iminobutanoate/2-iminopropanoate deaminase